MKPKVLIVEDSVSARHFVKSCLADRNLELIEAPDGRQGLAMLSEQCPDLVLLDLTMPVMDGFEALPKMKQLAPETPVVVLTADVQKRTVDRITDLGADLFLKKPPKKQLLLEAVERFLGK